MIRLVRADARDMGAFVAPASVELAYLDPPFAVGVRFTARTKKSETRGRETRSGAPVAYDDRWPSLESYLAWLEVRVAAVRDTLGDTGTMWLHLDHRAVHEAKALCDRVFGKDASVGEVIWVPGNGTKTQRGPGAGHQTLLIYAKTARFIWNAKDPALRAPFAATSLAMHFQSTDEAGRAYRDRTVNGKTYRYYADEGRALGSVWTDCPAMVANTPIHAEGTGYPTQKPLKLLDRIVRASSRPGSLVLDPFCGSGTTLCAAARLGRKAVGMDIGALAMDVATKRIRGLGLELTLEGSSASVSEPAIQTNEPDTRRSVKLPITDADETPSPLSGPSGSTAGVASPVTIPTDEDLEAGILGAVKLGLADVARTLSDQLRERQRARAGNVVTLDASRRKGGA